MLRRVLTTVACAAVVPILGGCGGDSAKNFSGEQHQVAEALEQMQRAGRKGDTKRICQKLLSRQILAEFKSAGLSCSEELSTTLKNSERIDVTVKSVQLAGVHATAAVEMKDNGKKRTSNVPLIKESGTWRIASLEK